MQSSTIYEGRNIKRIREILGIKQDALALDLGLSQQAVSQLEQKEAIGKEMLEKVAKALKVTPEAIQNFNEEAAVSVISNSFSSHDNSTFNAVNYHCTFNPIEKIVELYERLLKSEKGKNELLEKLLKERRPK